MGNPVIEILKDGAAFWEDLPGAKQHFTFGITKAMMILSCMKWIQHFLDSPSSDLDLLQPKSVSSLEWGNTCTIQAFPGFKRRGAWVEKPYLEISAGDTKIAFGRLKAESLILLQNELKKFVQEKYGAV